MTAAAFALIVRIAGLFGVKLSPFIAGAILAGVLAAAFGIYSLKLYNAGFASAESQCEAEALRSQIAALTKDRDDANRAAAEASLRASAILQRSETEAERTSRYVAELESRPIASPDAAPNKPSNVC